MKVSVPELVTTFKEIQSQLLADFSLILLTTGNQPDLTFTERSARDLYSHLADAFQSKAMILRTISIIGMIFFALFHSWTVSSKTGWFRFQHLGQIPTEHLAHVQLNHLKTLLRLILNVVENPDDLMHTHFDFHRHLFFYRGMCWSVRFIGKAPFPSA